MRIWGDTVEYKGIKIHPVTMDNCEAFFENVSCLMYEKNKIQDIRIIKMDYITFLFALMQHDENGNEIYNRLDNLLSMVLIKSKYEFLYTDDGLIFLKINEVIMSGYDFDNIKKIILEENGIRNEEILDSQMEMEMKELEEFNAKESKPATLEERIVTLHCLSSIPYQDIRKYTIFQFNQTLLRHSIIKNFDVYSALMAESGASKDIVHFLAHIEEKGRFENLAMSEVEFNKINAIGSNS